MKRVLATISALNLRHKTGKQSKRLKLLFKRLNLFYTSNVWLNAGYGVFIYTDSLLVNFLHV
jgi:hypothetical protein